MPVTHTHTLCSAEKELSAFYARTDADDDADDAVDDDDIIINVLSVWCHPRSYGCWNVRAVCVSV